MWCYQLPCYCNYPVIGNSFLLLLLLLLFCLKLLWSRIAPGKIVIQSSQVYVNTSYALRVEFTNQVARWTESDKQPANNQIRIYFSASFIYKMFLARKEREKKLSKVSLINLRHSWKIKQKKQKLFLNWSKLIQTTFIVLYIFNVQ